MFIYNRLFSSEIQEPSPPSDSADLATTHQSISSAITDLAWHLFAFTESSSDQEPASTFNHTTEYKNSQIFEKIPRPKSSIEKKRPSGSPHQSLIDHHLSTSSKIHQKALSHSDSKQENKNSHPVTQPKHHTPSKHIVKKSKRRKKSTVRQAAGSSPINQTGGFQITDPTGKILPPATPSLQSTVTKKRPAASRIDSTSDPLDQSTKPIFVQPSLGLKETEWAASISECYHRKALPSLEFGHGGHYVSVELSREMLQNIQGLRKTSDHHISLNILNEVLKKKGKHGEKAAAKARGENAAIRVKVRSARSPDVQIWTFVFKKEPYHKSNGRVKLVTAYRSSIERIAQDQGSSLIAVKKQLQDLSPIEVQHDEEFLELL